MSQSETRTLTLRRAEHAREAPPSPETLVGLRLEVGDLKSLPRWLSKCERLRSLHVTSYRLKSLPKSLMRLSDLRQLTLNGCSELKSIPAWAWALPRLEKLHLFETGVRRIPGLEGAPALLSLIVFSRTDPASARDLMEQVVERLEGLPEVASVCLDPRMIAEVKIERVVTIELPRGKSAAARRERAAMLGTLPSKFDCREIDLEGQTFEGLEVDLDLRGANLAKTTWRDCRFSGSKLSETNAAGAVFERCSFPFRADLSRLQAPGSAFRSCELGASLAGANLAGAVVQSAADSFLRLEKASLRDAKIEALFSSPQHGNRLDLSGADLRGARIQLLLTSAGCARVAKSKLALRWKRAKTRGARRDAKTKVRYASLARSEAEPTRGPIADPLGTLCGANAACWFVVADSDVARAWKGSQLDEEYAELPGTDFGRALEAEEGPIAIGEGKGVLANIGDCGCAVLWKVADSWCLVYADFSQDLDPRSKRGQELIGARVAQLPAKETEHLGEFQVNTGCMTLLLPYLEHAFSARQIAGAKKSGRVRGLKGDQEALLVPARNASYRVSEETLDHEDEVGRFYSRIRIRPAGR